MNYIFTKNGERKVENFIQSCIEKRKKIINEGIDTGDLVDTRILFLLQIISEKNLL